MPEEHTNSEVAQRLGDVVDGKDLRRMLRPLIVGALQSCIHAHGPITHKWVPSATKRIVTQISSRLKVERRNNDIAAMCQTRSFHQKPRD